jgi:hypothetical protein
MEPGIETNYVKPFEQGLGKLIYMDQNELICGIC